MESFFFFGEGMWETALVSFFFIFSFLYMPKYLLPQFLSKKKEWVLVLDDKEMLSSVGETDILL